MLSIFNLHLLFLLYIFNNTNSFMLRTPSIVLTQTDRNKFNPFSRKYYENLANKQKNETDNNNINN